MTSFCVKYYKLLHFVLQSLLFFLKVTNLRHKEQQVRHTREGGDNGLVPKVLKTRFLIVRALIFDWLNH